MGWCPAVLLSCVFWTQREMVCHREWRGGQVSESRAPPPPRCLLQPPVQLLLLLLEDDGQN